MVALLVLLLKNNTLSK